MTDWQEGSITILIGDCRERLRELADESVDALCTDPPAGISFMGATWDTFPTPRRSSPTFRDGRARPGIAQGQEHDARGRSAFVAFMTEVAVECRRILRPGAHGLVWAIPRTSHWTATALEDAGFEVRDVITHHFGNGFPKGKSALKPASEHWILVRKPLAAANVAANVLEHGTGALNVDACRVATGERLVQGAGRPGANFSDDSYEWPGGTEQHPCGRWPANLVLSHADGCRPAGMRRVKGTNRHGPRACAGLGYHGNGQGAARPGEYCDAQGLEVVERWECVQDCPVAALDRQAGWRSSGVMGAGTIRKGIGYNGDLGTIVAHSTYGDQGMVSRFFYVAKASTAERNAGLTPGSRNLHPTVKPIALMRWLCRLITPPGGTVVDPFMGSGTTGIAAKLEGFGFLGIEQGEEAVTTAIARLSHWQRQPGLFEEPA